MHDIIATEWPGAAITSQVNYYDLTRHKNSATFTNLLAAVAHYNGTAKSHAADIFIQAVLPCEL